MAEETNPAWGLSQTTAQLDRSWRDLFSRLRAILYPLFIAIPLALVGCGGDGGDAVTIGPEGGTVTSSDGLLKLTIPEGALATPTEITITKLAIADIDESIREAFDIHGHYKLEPDGQQFNLPVTVALTYPGANSASNQEIEVPQAFILHKSGQAISLPETQEVALDADAGTVTVSAQISSFSQVWDNLPRDGSLRVRFSGVPNTALVGSGFAASATVSSSATSKISIDQAIATLEGARPVFNSDLENTDDKYNLGAFSPNNARTVTESASFGCSASGTGLFLGKVEFNNYDLFQMLTLEGALLAGFDGPTSTIYTSRARRAVACINGTGGDSGTDGNTTDPGTPTPSGVIGLNLSTSAMSFVHHVGSTECWQTVGTFSVANTGTTSGAYSVTPSTSSLAVSPESFTLGAGETTNVTVSFTCAQTTSFTGTLQVTGTGTGGPVNATVTVSGEVGP